MHRIKAIKSLLITSLVLLVGAGAEASPHSQRHFTPGEPRLYKKYECDPRYEYTAQLIRVVDGDTMDFLFTLGLHTYREERIRLWGIDTPEINTRNQTEKTHGLKAKAAAEKWIRKNSVGGFIQICTRQDDVGKYGRYIADVLASSKIGGPRTLSRYLRAADYEKRR